MFDLSGKPNIRSLWVILLLTSIACVQWNCAFMDKKNRRITNALDENFTPETDNGKLAMAPLAIPAGTVSLLSDTFVVQPLIAIPKALGDTIDFIWLDPGGGIILQSFLFVPKLVFTPITFAVMWVRHAFII